MKKELIEKKLYIAPMLQIITVDCHDIIATSGDGDSSDGDEGDGTGDGYWHEGLI